MTIRTFVALEIPGFALNQLLKIKEDSIGDIGKVKWEPLEKLHITLKFLGDTDENKLDVIVNSLEECLSTKKKLELSFERFGCFYRDNKPKILWAGLKENYELIQLAKEMDNIFSIFGYQKEERKFKPHITLLRFKGFEDSNKILTLTKIKLPKIDFTSDTVKLYKSTLKQSGSVYESIKSFELK